MNEQAKEAVIEIIKSQVSLLSYTHIRYEYNTSQSLHIVDIEADNLDFLSQDEWQNRKYKLVDEFEEEFVDESLLFVNKNSPIRANVNDLVFELKPNSNRAEDEEAVEELGISDRLTWEKVTANEYYSLYTVNNSTSNVIKKRKRKYIYSPPIDYKNFEQNIKSVLASARTDLFCYSN